MKGVASSAGVGIASAVLVHEAVSRDFMPRRAGKPEVELARFEQALAAITDKNNQLCEKAARHFTNGEAAIFDAYAAMIQDEDAVIIPTRAHISAEGFTAEYAVLVQFGELAEHFLAMTNDYLRQRAEDVFFIRDQLLAELSGAAGAGGLKLLRPTIIVARNISATDLASLDISRVEGIVCEGGGYSSHTAIFARALGIPAVMGAGGIFNAVEDGDVVGLDGETGEVWVRPGAEEIAFLHARADKVAQNREEALLFRGQPTVSTDGRRVELMANAAKVEDLASPTMANAESIGMLRTENIQPAPFSLPSEEEQFRAYRRALDCLNGKSACVRTFDDGGTALLSAVRRAEERNPALGHRGIRMSLARPSFFRTQLRAILRASAFGNLKIMFPMVASRDELEEAKRALEAIRTELAREGVPFDENMPVGMLVSLPAAALMAEVFAGLVDFFSISLSDLIQFTVGVDKQSPGLSNLFHPFHPQVLRLVKWTADAAHHHNIPCHICGEVPGFETVLPVLFGLGIDGFSVAPSMVLPCRRVLNGCSYAKCRRLAEEVLGLASPAEVTKRLAAFPAQGDKA